MLVRSPVWIIASLLGGCAVATPPESAGGPDAGAAPAPGADAAPPEPQSPSAGCVDALAALGEDFESSAGEWSHRTTISTTVEWPFDEWEHGAADGAGCRGGSGCWGTALAGNYVQCARAELISPPMDLSACAGEDVALALHQSYDFWTGPYGDETWSDGGVIEISGDGESWQLPEEPAAPGIVAINPERGSAYECVQSDRFYVDGMPGYTGSSGGWTRLEIPIPAELLTESFRVRFRYASGVSSQTTDADQSRSATAPGWYLDDLAFEAR